MRTRNIAADADNGGEIVVAGGALDQDAEAGVGKSRAGIFDHRMNDLTVAAFDENIRHRFA